MTEVAHPNTARMWEGYEAFAKGDLGTLTELWREDVHWHEQGNDQVAGDYEGPQAVFGMFARLGELTENSLRVEPLLVCADDEYGTALVRVTAHRGDRHMDTLGAHVVRFDGDGKLAEFWNALTEPDVVDAFYDGQQA
ncbi:nuclear transport factor 2 family protein [Geodermatophilus sp. SYSU D01036]